jgi:hypothetical protein
MVALCYAQERVHDAGLCRIGLRPVRLGQRALDPSPVDLSLQRGSFSVARKLVDRDHVRTNARPC